MDMLSYLTSLVKTSKEVGIPGIGTIYKKKSPGRYDVQSHSFLPPSYTLTFSEELAESFALTEFVSKKRNISVAAATYFVEQFAEEINKQLNDQHEASLGSLGTLHNQDGTLTFQAGNPEDFGFEYYGLPAIKDEVWTEKDAVAGTSPEHNDVLAENNIISEENISENNSPNETADPINPVSGAAVTPAQSEPEDSNTVTPNESPVDHNENLKSEIPQARTEGPDETDDEYAVYEEITELGLPEKVAQVVPLPEIETPEGVDHIEDHAHLFVERPKPTLNETLAQSARLAQQDNSAAATPEMPQNVDPVYYHLDDETPEKTGMAWYLKLIIVLLVIAIAAAATYVVKPELFEQLLYKEQPAPPTLSEQALQNTADSIATADSIKRSIEAAMLADTLKKDTSSVSTTSNTASTTTNAASNPASAVPSKAKPSSTEKEKTPATVPATPEVLPAGTTFEVIGSSLSSQKEADRFLAQMKKLGINAKAFPGKKVIRISVATFKDDKSARAAIPALKEKLGINGLYVYTNKPE